MAANGSTSEQIKAMGNWISASVAHRYVHTSAVSMQKNAKTIAMPEVFFPRAEELPAKGDPPVVTPVVEHDDAVLQPQQQQGVTVVEQCPPHLRPRKRMRNGTIIISGPIHKLVVVNGSSDFGESQTQSQVLPDEE